MVAETVLQQVFPPIRGGGGGAPGGLFFWKTGGEGEVEGWLENADSTSVFATFWVKMLTVQAL